MLKQIKNLFKTESNKNCCSIKIEEIKEEKTKCCNDTKIEECCKK